MHILPLQLNMGSRITEPDMSSPDKRLSIPLRLSHNRRKLIRSLKPERKKQLFSRRDGCFGAAEWADTESVIFPLMTDMIHDAAFKSILFPVDFSQMSEIAAPHVRGLAQLTGASITLLHVVPWRSAWYGASEIVRQIPGNQLLTDLNDQAVTALDTFHTKHFAGGSFDRLVKEGPVAETITEIAEEAGADLIMMPTRGLGRTRPFLIGSTTIKVLHDASCAVWTSPHLETLKPFSSFRNILCAINRDSIPLGFVEEVARLATSFGSKLSFVTATSILPQRPFERHRSVRALHQEFPLARTQELIFPSDCEIFEEVGSIGEVVRKTVEMRDIDLVVVDRGHLKGPYGKSRTHTFEIVLESPCPVLSLCFSSPTKDDKSVNIADPQEVTG